MADEKNEVVVVDPAEKEIEQLLLCYKTTGDMEAKNEVILHYSRLVKRIVRRMMPKYNEYNEYDDLVNCGIIGLIDAVEKFDFKHGVKFETYAVSRIRGEILDYMRSQDWAPSSLRKKISAITGAYESLERAQGAAPTDDAVAKLLEIPVSQVRKIMAQTHIFNLVNFEDMISPNRTIGDLAGRTEETPEDLLLAEEMKRVLAELIDSLPEKEKQVITLYYYEELMIKEIAGIFGVSESRISQIHSKVLAKMRLKLQQLVR